MSRLAKKPIMCPKGVELKLDGMKILIKGPKGNLSIDLLDGIDIEINGNQVEVKAKPDLQHRPFLGLSLSLLKNAMIGVSEGFEKKLELIGVGFKAAVKGENLDLALGFSHPNIVPIPQELKVEVEKNTRITITGIDKRIVGQFAASVRAIRPPEPYKGKGVRYHDEVVRRKAGKTSK